VCQWTINLRLVILFVILLSLVVRLLALVTRHKLATEPVEKVVDVEEPRACALALLFFNLCELLLLFKFLLLAPPELGNLDCVLFHEMTFLLFFSEETYELLGVFDWVFFALSLLRHIALKEYLSLIPVRSFGRWEEVV